MSIEQNLAAATDAMNAARVLWDLKQAAWQAQVDAMVAGLVTNVYVDAVDGNDARSGVSQAQSVKTIARALQLTKIGGVTNWFLKAGGGGVYDVTGRNDCTGRMINVAPWVPPPGLNGDLALYPIIRFANRPISGGPIASTNLVGGQFRIRHCQIQTAEAIAGTYTEDGGFLAEGGSLDCVVDLTDCNITLREQSLQTTGVAGNPVLSLVYSRVLETGVPRQGKLMRWTAFAPGILNVLNTTLPAGRTIEQMLEILPGTPVDAQGRPQGLLTNVSFA